MQQDMRPAADLVVETTGNTNGVEDAKPKRDILSKHSSVLDEMRAFNPNMADRVAAAIEEHENARDQDATGRSIRRHPRVTGISHWAVVQEGGKPHASVSLIAVPDTDSDDEEPVDRGTHILVPLS
ncbi:MAG: hypothetical protein NVSMB31_01230 [Vulcanimicrobiaceae bacterium]